MLRFVSLLSLLTVSTAICSAENAALSRYGASISITGESSKPLNERWAKAADLLKEKPNGPIINDLATARVVIGFPMIMQISRVEVTASDYKDTWSRAKTIDIEVDGQVVATLNIPNDAEGAQGVDVQSKTNQVTLVVKDLHPPRDGGKVVYGGFARIAVLVDDDLEQRFAAPTTFPSDLTPWIMPTANLDARPDIQVLGKPRMATGHPCTIWDAQDIADMKQQIATVPQAKEAFDRCVAGCEKLLADPLTIPDEPDLGTNPKVASAHTRAVEGIATLGIGYVLSGDERYAEACKQLLIQLADRYEGWPVHQHPQMKHDKSKWSWQRLGDAIWLVQAAWGFDLIQGSTSLSDAERDHIRDHFVIPCVKQILSSSSIIAAPTNWSTICCAAVMVGARACDNTELFETAIYGLKRPKDEPNTIGGNKGGIYYFIDNAIDDDGMWAEGAIGYQFMAIRGLVVMAETLWHNGIDVYGYQNSRLKLVFDSPIWYCYPGGSSSPAIHDSGSASLYGRDAHLYQYAARRYGDRTYDGILATVTPAFSSVYNQFMPACDFKPVEAVGLPPVPSTLFPGVGFATTRTGAGDASKYLILDYGPNRSHGHPDKLNHCLFALGTELFADGGSAWYTTDVYREYYSQTLAHNTVLANGVSQIASGGRLEAFCQSGSIGLIRAVSDEAIPATGLDRTLVLFGDRMYDLYRLGSAAPMNFDLPYHSGGALSVNGDLKAKLTNWEGERPSKAYDYITDATIAAWDADWSCDWKVAGGTMRMHALGVPGTSLVFGETPKGGSKLGTVVVRRNTQKTIFASVCDLIPNEAKASIVEVASLTGEQGYGMRTELVDGSSEIILVNMGEAECTIGDYRTDARVAALRIREGTVEAFVVAGGTQVHGPFGALTVSARALVSGYVVASGLARVANHSDQDIEVTWPGMTATTVAAVDAAGVWGASIPVTKGQFAVAAGSKVDLATGQQPTVAEWESQQRLDLQKAAAEAAAERQRAIAKQVADQQKAAEAEPVPADYQVVLQAEDFTGEGGGKVSIATNKAAVFGTCLSQWNDHGHWLEYSCDIAHSGWYQVAMKYCVEGESATRSLRIDGAEPQGPLAQIEVPGTGGWSNGVDNWKLVSVTWPESEVPYLVHLTAGKHVLRFENTAGGGMNFDYAVLVPSTVPVTRGQVEK